VVCLRAVRKTMYVVSITFAYRIQCIALGWQPFRLHGDACVRRHVPSRSPKVENTANISRGDEICMFGKIYPNLVNEKFSLSSTAALIADPARAAMLTALLDARPRSAGELARIANVSAQSASMHLSQLLTGGFLNVTQQGRHRYFRIGSHRIAHAIEALGTISTPPTFKPSVNNPDLCYARTCYDHLAGELGVKLAVAMEQNRLLIPYGDRDYEVTRPGWEFLARWHIDKEAVRNTRRAFARRCLDWTEKRYHLAGALGLRYATSSWTCAGSPGRKALASSICRRAVDVSWRIF